MTYPNGFLSDLPEPDILSLYDMVLLLCLFKVSKITNEVVSFLSALPLTTLDFSALTSPAENSSATLDKSQIKNNLSGRNDSLSYIY